jgi:AcrR family transcriptional regulator
MARPTVIRNEVILEAARTIFLERGILATSAEVAHMAGVSEGSIFKRFKTKADLFRAAMGVDLEDIPRALSALVTCAGTRTVEENLVDAGLQTVGFFQRVMPIMMMSWSNPRLPGGCVPNGCDVPDPPPIRAQRHVAEYLAAELKLGRIAPIKPEIIARAYLGALSTYVFSELLVSKGSGPHIESESYVREYVRTLLTGMQCISAERPAEAAVEQRSDVGSLRVARTSSKGRARRQPALPAASSPGRVATV